MVNFGVTEHTIITGISHLNWLPYQSLGIFNLALVSMKDVKIAASRMDILAKKVQFLTTSPPQKKLFGLRIFAPGNFWRSLFVEFGVISMVVNAYVVIFTNFASQSSQKFPLQYMAIHSNENIAKITKLSQNCENICTQNIWHIHVE